MQLVLFPHYELAADSGISAKGNNFKGFSLAHNVRSEQAVNQLILKLESKEVIIVIRSEKVFGAVTVAISRIRMAIFGRFNIILKVELLPLTGGKKIGRFTESIKFDSCE